MFLIIPGLDGIFQQGNMTIHMARNVLHLLDEHDHVLPWTMDNVSEVLGDGTLRVEKKYFFTYYTY